jgi:hypothetical protein
VEVLPSIDHACKFTLSEPNIEAGYPVAGLNISCQDVNFREIQDMKRRSKHFGGMSELRYIAES